MHCLRDQTHLGAAHEFFDIAEHLHAIANEADDQQVITSDTPSTTMPTTWVPMLSTIAPRKLTAPLTNAGAWAMRVG